MQHPQPLGTLRRHIGQLTEYVGASEEAITVTNRTELHRQRQQMRQRIRAQVTARRIAVATALAEAEATSAEEPSS